MTRLSFEQEQALIARGRSLQGDAIQKAVVGLFRLPGKLAEAIARGLSGGNSADAGHEGRRPA